MAGGISLLLASCGGATAEKAASIKPAGSDLGAVEHVVFLMHENRSFDHYFGTYKGVRGFDDARARSDGLFAQAWPGGAAPTLAPLPSRHGHDRGRVHLRPLAPVGRPAPVLERREDGPLRRRPHRAALGGAGERRPHHGLLHPAGPRLLLLAGRRLHHLRRLPLLGHGPDPPEPSPRLVGDTRSRPGWRAGPWCSPNSAPSAQGSATWSTMPEALEDAGVSWKVYNAPGSDYQPTSGVAMALSDNILLYFKQYMDPSSALYQKAFGPALPQRLRERHHPRHAAARCRGSPRRTATTNTRPRLRPLGMWFSHNVIQPWCPTRRSGRRRSCSSCTTRTTASSTTWPRRRRRRGRRAST